MTAHRPFAAFKALTGTLVGVLLSCVVVSYSHAAPTELGTEPFSMSAKINALPNIMFVLDDSGSMRGDFLPDWAGPYQATVGGVLTTITPPHRFFNGAYNGVAYNPGTYYQPPVMYSNDGTLDTTSYPSMTGQSVTTGGDASATALQPNWRAVKLDGYGIQSTDTRNIEGNAFSYTTVAGEYCTSGQLRTCVESATPTTVASVNYNFPAKLRWCTTSDMSLDTTVNAGTNCQASNIETTDAGVQNYTYPRMPRPRIATITVSVAGTVTGITVDTQQILSNASVSGGTMTDLATAIRDSINACTLGKVGAVCTIVGYSATSSDNVVTVTAPGAITSTPVITAGTATVSATAFAGNNVPGASLFTVITPTVESYPYPGTAAKDPKRVDCAGSTCTYVEEMTNYANWHAYYRTRMQMMKTSSSIAFSSVTDKFRVGYYSINNGAGSQFLNVGAFEGAQKNQWYSKFFSARPYGVTPLRTGLSNIGRMYAGKVSLLNGETVNDPMQYSCQQNFTILSTDGYWNDAANPTQVDGTTEIGQQDGNDPRPYYDGATQTRTVSQTTRSDLQVGFNTFLIESMTRQQQTSTSRLDQTVDTKDIYPWKTQTSTLQTQTTPLNRTDYSLVQSTYPLTSTTKELQESTYTLDSTPRILQSSLNRLTQTTTPLDALTYNVTATEKLLNQSYFYVTRWQRLLSQDNFRVTRSSQYLTKKVFKVTRARQRLTEKQYKVTRATQLLTRNVFNVTQAEKLLTRKVYNVTQAEKLLTRNVYNVTQAEKLLTSRVYNTTVTRYPLQSSTYKLRSSTRQLQKNMEASDDGGDTWASTGWVDVASCNTSDTVPNIRRNIQCRYNTPVDAGGLDTCTNADASVGPVSYTVGTAVTCAYETTPTVAAVATCSVLAQPNMVSGAYSFSRSCAYSTTSSVDTGQTSCAANDQAGASPMTGDKVVCTYDATPTTTTNLATCTWVVPSPSASAPRTDCSYQAASTSTGLSACSAAPEATATTHGAVWNTARACTYDAAPTTTTTNLATCTWVVPSPSASATRTDCSYQTATTSPGLSACSAALEATDSTNGAVWNTARACTYDATPTTTTNLATCTWVVPVTAASETRTDCSYQTATNSPGLSACSAATEATATTHGAVWNTARACTYDTAPTTTTPNLATCTWGVPSPSASAPKTDCSYQAATNSSGRDTCSASAAGTDSTQGAVWSTAVTCTYDAAPSSTDTDRTQCTWVVPSPFASSKRTDCIYETAVINTGEDSCSAATAGTATTDGAQWNTARTCTYDDTPSSTNTNRTNCEWVVPSPVASSPRTDCIYQSPDISTGTDSCTAATAGTATTDGAVWNYARTCAYDTTPTTTPNLATCTWVVPVTAASVPKTECRYQNATSTPHQESCVARSEDTATTNGSVWQTAKSCTYDTAEWNYGVSSCTWLVPDPPASGPKRECSYQAATTYTGRTTCAAEPEGTVTTNGTVWNTARTCAYDATPTSTLANQTSCEWEVPSPAASKWRRDCIYNASALSTSTVDSCPALAKSTGTTDGTVWAGPNVDCAYQAPVLSASNLGECNAGAATVGVPKTSYTTCSYVNGTTLTGQNSCTLVADSTANPYRPANACAYSTTPVVANVGSCTARAKDLVSFSLPQITCAYETTGTPATSLSSCNDVPPSSGAYPWTGPSRTCAYSEIATVLSNPASCTVNVEAGPSYTEGAKVSCAYAGGVASNNVATCTAQAKQTLTADGTVYSPARDCAWGGASGWLDATAACVPVAKTGTSPNAGPDGPARECRYTAPTELTVAATCTAASEDNINLTARNCVAGPFPVDISNVTTTVDECSTTPTTNGASPVERRTTTTCNYRAPLITETTSCTPLPLVPVAAPNYVTTVSCPLSNAAQTYVPVDTCTYQGTPPATPDAVTGKVVDCRKTDQTDGGTSLPITSGTMDSASVTPVSSVPAANCTPGIDEVSKVQTKCTTMLDTGPDPVQTCTTVNPPVAPSFVKTTCETTSTPTIVMGCLPQAPSSPLWQTITCVYNEGTGTYNTLADVSAYYYKTDLRTSALNNCTGSIVPPATVANALCSANAVQDAKLNNVPTTPKDPNSAQHMTTFTLGMGVSGYMRYSSSYETDVSGDYATVYGTPNAPASGNGNAAANAISADPSNGVCSWQSTGNCNWPVPISDEQTAIDDLWHAGVNGHGSYFSATDPVSLGNSIAATLAQVAAAVGAVAAPTVSNTTLRPGDSYIFISSYVTSDWTGELTRRQLNPNSAEMSANNDWSAQGKLDSNTYTSRNIYTFDSSVATTKLKPFTSANFAGNEYFLSPHISSASTGLSQYLCASPNNCLSESNKDSSHAAGANLVNFLRGDRTHEGDDNTRYYRQRQHVLGDMVNAQVVYVKKPSFSYTDRGYAEESTGFVATNSSRPSMVYAGANDGMLHAFHAKGNTATEALVSASAAATAAAIADPSSTAKSEAAAAAATAANAAVAADTIIGQELWAYIPSMVMPNLYALADKRYKDKHRYYVDATPVVGDICISDCSSGDPAVWKTILVGGLGRGGRGYYALDITDPANPKALWEFTDTNLGYSYGNPQIVKLKCAVSDSTCNAAPWVVLVTSGYNNIANDDGAGGDGQGRLYVINAATGALIQSITTGSGDTTSPSGLAKITARVNNPMYDNTVVAVYGGDLYGKLWRFDVNKAAGEAQLLAVLKDASNNLQPITTKPEVARIPEADAIVVYIGTGRFLAPVDANDASQQTIYAIKDPVVETAAATPAAELATAIYTNPRALESFIHQVQTEIDCPQNAAEFICAPSSRVRTSTSSAVEFASDNGWLVDLLGVGERANTDVKIALGGLYFNTNIPTLAACDLGGESYQYFLDYKTGGAIKSPGTSGVVGRPLAGQLASSITVVMTGDGTLRSISGLSGGGVNVGQPPLPPEAWPTRRTAWRELIRE